MVIQKNFGNVELYNNTLWENSTYYDIQYLNQTYSDETKAAALKLSLNATCTD